MGGLILSAPRRERQRRVTFRKKTTRAGRTGAGLVSSLCLLQRAKEVEQVLLLPVVERVVVAHDSVRLGRVVVERVSAAVLLDRLHQVGGPAVMQEEDALTHTPQRRRAELT